MRARRWRGLEPRSRTEHAADAWSALQSAVGGGKCGGRRVPAAKAPTDANTFILPSHRNARPSRKKGCGFSILEKGLIRGGGGAKESSGAADNPLGDCDGYHQVALGGTTTRGRHNHSQPLAAPAAKVVVRALRGRRPSPVLAERTYVTCFAPGTRLERRFRHSGRL